MQPEVEVAMFHLDYLSCFLTILATVLVSRKSWTGLLISIVNSMIVCVIGFRTSQFGKPDLHLCICIQPPVLGQEDSHAPDPPALGRGTTETTMVNAPYT